MLGQSFGGFCAMRYLSAAPEGLREVLFTGGVPPLEAHVDEVYRATLRAHARAQRALLRALPRGPRRGCCELLERVGGEPLRLPERRSAAPPTRVRQLGARARHERRLERLHYLLELDPDSPAFLHDAEQATHASRATRSTRSCTRPAGPTAARRRWSAQRVLDEQLGLAAGVPHRRAHLPVDVRGAAARAAARGRRAARRSASGRALYDLERLRANQVPARRRGLRR